jgi:TRAP-type C4-dicarboxylate transport system permease small subunit
MSRFAAILGCIFGYLFVGLALLIGLETVGRKLFGFSLQGTDELSGYVLAVASCLAFSAAVVGKTHIRIDILYTRMPEKLQVLLNWLAAVGIALAALLMVWAAWHILEDSIAYQSMAATPWATPLVYPQSLWFCGLIFFLIIAFVPALNATRALLRGDRHALLDEFAPPSARKEVEEELEDLERRKARNADQGGAA